MHDTAIPALFEDAPQPEQLPLFINPWRRPAPPGGLADVTLAFTAGGENIIRRQLGRTKSRRHKNQLEVKLISWLYDFIRTNVKRGRLFDLGEVLQQGSADCLGYSKLFTLLGRLLGLDVGVIEVVIDNEGRYVPHTAILVSLTNQQPRLVDLWYGAKSILHQRLGLSVRRGGVWQIEDVDLPALRNLEAVSHLPDSCVNAITRYIRGNRHLNRQEFASAIRCYSAAIVLYPGNARFFYNRAIAYENLGEAEKATADYNQALSSEAAVIRVLAKEHDAVTSLINRQDTPNQHPSSIASETARSKSAG